MDAFRTRYLAKCAELGIEPLRCILDSLLLRDNSSSIKDLSGSKTRTAATIDVRGQALSVKACTALAAGIAEDAIFERYMLGDAFLGDDGCIILANALKTNTAALYVDLRGNNIRSDGATAVAQMLKVNTSLRTLILEWNCIGIWETGARAMADALSINKTLEELDLRNNKIGPQSAQAIALSLKHNTALKKLDFRWNNAGIIGGRALVDLLRWNTVLVGLDMIGNEIPDDVSRSLAIALERNRERSRTEQCAKTHSEHMASTLQTIAQVHREALENLGSKLNSTEARVADTSKRLTAASDEIQAERDAKTTAEAKLDRITVEMRGLEDTLAREREDVRVQIHRLNKEIIAEREKRVLAEESAQKAEKKHTKQLLELEASVSDLEMRLEVLKRDKALLFEDLSQSREREKSLQQLMDEKAQRMEANHVNQLSAVAEKKDREFRDKIQKLEDRLRSAEQDKLRVDEVIQRHFRILMSHSIIHQELDAQKAKYLSQKRALEEKLAELENRRSQDEELHKKELAEQSGVLQDAQRRHQEHVAELGRQHSEQLAHLRSQLTQAKAEVASATAAIDQVRERTNSLQTEADRRERTLVKELESARADVVRAGENEVKLREKLQKEVAEAVARKETEMKAEVERLVRTLEARARVIEDLQDELRRQDALIAELEGEQVDKMKELQMQVATMIAQKTASVSARIRSRSPLRMEPAALLHRTAVGDK
ncbi:hypothetical protein BJ742DRAFT_872004 [Cladochytrium replicatum]|nr:hypothetical protein BJ742DRAFT_872004 [Cladochytrium replicatum]